MLFLIMASHPIHFGCKRGTVLFTDVYKVEACSSLQNTVYLSSLAKEKNDNPVEYSLSLAQL